MSECITLSSDEENEHPPKRINLGDKNKLNLKDELLEDIEKFLVGSEISIVPKSDATSHKVMKEEINSTEIIILDQDSSPVVNNKTTEIIVLDQDSSSVVNNKTSIDLIEIKDDDDDCIHDDQIDDYFSIPTQTLETTQNQIEDTETKINEITQDESVTKKENEEPNDVKIVDGQQDEIQSVDTIDNGSENGEDCPSTSTDVLGLTPLNEFLEICTNSVNNSGYEKRLKKLYPNIEKYFKDCVRLHNRPEFVDTIEKYKTKAATSPESAVVSFRELSTYLLDNSEKVVIIEENNLEFIQKLEKTCRLLIRKIKQLEEAEVNWSDEENSSYVKADKYKERLHKVYAKYCEYINRDPYLGRKTIKGIKFTDSQYKSINVAITKFCKKCSFPTYWEIEKIVKKCVQKDNLLLDEGQIKLESRQCFEKLGSMAQLLRKRELYDCHKDFIDNQQDPAANNKDLKQKLAESLKDGQKQLKLIIEKYVTLQETGNENHESDDAVTPSEESIEDSDEN